MGTTSSLISEENILIINENKKIFPEKEKNLSKSYILESNNSLRELGIGQYFLDKLKNLDSNSKDFEKEEKILEIWNSIMLKRDNSSSFPLEKIKIQLKKNLPMKYRWTIWKILLNISISNEDENNYIKLSSNQCERDIKKDLHRTFPNENFFSSKFLIGQEKLSRLLTAISMNYPTIGYCQGMNFISGFILSLSGGNEIEAFYVFNKLIKNYQTHFLGFYEQNFELVHLFTHLFMEKFKKLLPKLHRIITDPQEGLKDYMWINKWFMTLFLYVFPISVVVRIWDFIIIENSSLFLIKIALAFLKIYEKKLILMENFEINEFFKIFKNDEYSVNKTEKIDLEKLIKKARKINLSRDFVSKNTKEFLIENKSADSIIFVKMYQNFNLHKENDILKKILKENDNNDY